MYHYGHDPSEPLPFTVHLQSLRGNLIGPHISNDRPNNLQIYARPQSLDIRLGGLAIHAE